MQGIQQKFLHVHVLLPYMLKGMANVDAQEAKHSMTQKKKKRQSIPRIFAF